MRLPKTYYQPEHRGFYILQIQDPEGNYLKDETKTRTIYWTKHVYATSKSILVCKQTKTWSEKNIIYKDMITMAYISSILY